MKVIILNPTQVAGVWYYPAPHAQDVSEDVGQHLIQAKLAREFVTKVVEVTEKKSSSVSQQGQASPQQTQKKPRGRPRKSSASTTVTD